MANFISHAAVRIALLGAASFSFVMIPAPAVAQDVGADAGLEEIIVTARKREENLRDVPVSISVLNSTLIQDAGISNQYDLFEMTPGLTYDDGNNFGDRNAGTPGIRGVQSLEIASTRQKATSFIDGMPMNGQTGALQFVDVERIEVYRGPQSAAFGRATFAGAINYITKDPTDELSGFLAAGVSDLERQQVEGGFTGPLGDKVGFALHANYEEVRGNPDWVTTDGYDLGNVQSTYITAKLKFNPTDRVEGAIKYMHLETEDGNGANFNIVDPSCLNYSYTDQQGRPQAYLQGNYNCDSSLPDGGIQRNHDTASTYDPSDPDYALALSYAVLDPTVTLNRDRIQGNLDFDIGESSLQFLAYYSEDEAQRWQDADRSDTALIIAMGMVGMNVNTMADPNAIDESYAEVRWVSPGDSRFQYVVGASYYNYNFLTEIYAQYAGIVLDLEGELGQPVLPLQVFSEEASNVGGFFNLTYDATEKMTLSFEGRYQSDDISSINSLTGESFNNVTTSFQPRLAINYAISDVVSVYGQYSIGNNPAGVNINFTSPQAIAAIQLANAAGEITYDEETYLNFDEEQLTNVEVGLKADFLDNRLSVATALYFMEWEDMVQPYNLNWDGDWNDNGSGGTLFPPPFTMSRSFINQGTAEFMGLEGDVTWRATDNFQIHAGFAIQTTEYTDFCSPWPVDTLNLPPDRFAEDGEVAADCVTVDGNEVVRQPKVSFNLSPSYRAPIGSSGWEWSTRLDWRRSGSNYLDDYNLMKLPNTDIVNMSVAFNNDMFNLRLYADNITDEDLPGSVGYATDYNLNIGGAVDNLYIVPRRPREFGLRVQVGF